MLLVLVVASAAVGFVISAAAGILTTVSALTLCVLFIIFTKTRYDRIASMSAQIDQMLHGRDNLAISDYDEGELAIMQNVLQKIILRLRTQADNLQQDKLYLSDSLADIAHQIRTPLTSINLLTSLLAREGQDLSKRPELIRELETLLARIDWLITTLLKIAKIDAGTAIFTTAEISVNTLIDKALEPFVIPLELRCITIERRDGPHNTLPPPTSPLPSLNCDLAWTAEALGNIIKNCLEHVEHGGVIRIEATQNPVYTEINISDNGSGFAEKDLPHLFERFYKGQNAHDNSFGIGLALSRMIITQQNGVIKAGNNTPQGARFNIRFYHQQSNCPFPISPQAEGYQP
jgi:signal transduction histidine kinase